jgi:hypothetical protein
VYFNGGIFRNRNQTGEIQEWFSSTNQNSKMEDFQIGKVWSRLKVGSWIFFSFISDNDTLTYCMLRSRPLHLQIILQFCKNF